MRFSLDVVRARKGDCLLLHYGTAETPGLVLIDGGPAGVYRPHLLPRLRAVATARGLGEEEPVPIDVLMVSHVDDDHINGILEMTRAMRDADEAQRARPAEIFGLWHNGFDDVIGNRPEELLSGLARRFGPASTEGELPDDLDLDDDGRDAKDVRASLQVLSSIKQGAQLRRDAEFLELEVNADFGGELIVAREGTEAVPLDDELAFTVAGPLIAEIEALQEKHDAWLKELAKEGKTPEDVLTAYVDASVANLSSLVFLAASGGRTMLLTGDARGDKVLDGLRLVGLLGPDADTLHVDVLKVPHHGSEHNVETDFFRRVTADHYVFSGDGVHGNPERATFEMLLAARGADAPYTLHLTYPVDEIDVERKKDWEKEQAKERRKREEKPGHPVREDWSPAEHSLAGLFAAKPAFGAKVRVVGEDEAHVIDLREPLGF
jgi:hypothetical protein